jgi:hypothetical protein
VVLVLVVLLCSDVETREEGAAAMMGAGPVCWALSDPTPDAGAVAVMGFAPLPAVFTGAESVAKELGDMMVL